MATFKRSSSNGVHGEEYSVGLNIVLTGSKNLSQSDIEKLLSTGSVKVVIVDAENENRVLVDEVVEAKQFSTGSVRFGLNTKGAKFS